METKKIIHKERAVSKSNVVKCLKPHFWVLSVLPGWTGLFLSAGKMLPFREIVLVTLILSAVSGIAELTNGYIDQTLDRFQKTKKLGILVLSGGSDVSLAGGLKRNEVLSVTGLFLLIVIASAILINVYVLLLALVALFMAIGYSLEPIRLKSRGPLGLLDMAVGRGFVSFHMGWLAFSLPTVTSISAGLYLSLLAFGTASLAHLADYQEDKELNICTFPVLVGFKRASIIAAGAIIMAFLFLAVATATLLVAPNILVFLLFIMGLVLCYFMVTMKAEDSHKVSSLQVVGISLFSLAPFVFI